MAWIALCFGICLLSPQQPAVPVQTIRGTVVDRETQAPLEGAAIAIADSPTGAFSDAEGRFALRNLPSGRYTIQVAMLGYQSLTLSALELGSGKELVLNIQMDPSPLFLETVTIRAEPEKNRALNDMAMTSARQFSLQEANRYAAGYGDPARMAVSFAGVTSSGDDDNNEIVIRGNSPKGLLWRLEGIEIPNPNHFSDGQGATSGIISMINTNSLANSDFFTGAFPAEYGNAASGVFDLRFRRGNDQRHEGMAQLSVIGLEAAAEGPLPLEGASYRVNVRYSTLELLFKTGLLNIDPGSFNPAYRDFNYTFNFPTQKAGTFTLWALAGLSLADDEDTGSKETGRQGLGVWGLGHKIPVGKSGYIYSAVAWTKESSTYYRDNLIDNRWINTRDQTYAYQNLRASSYYNARLSKRLTLRSGAIASSLGYYLDENRWDNARKRMVNFLEEDGGTWFLQAYSQFKYQAGTRLSATAGVHYSRFLLNGQQGLEPRFGLRYQVTPNASWNLGFGLHSRLEPVSVYLYKRRVNENVFVQPNRNIGPLKAAHYVLGYSRTFGPHTRLNVEVYYQNLHNIPVDSSSKSTFSLLNASSGIPSNVLDNEGLGENTGIEGTLERSFANGYYYLLTTSLFKSIYRAGDQKWRNTVFNNSFAYNLLFGKEFALGRQKQHFLVLNLRYMVRGGNRYTPINIGESTRLNTTVYTNYLAYVPRLPTYKRLDAGVSYKINRAHATWRFSADIQNITNRKNPVEQRYSTQTKALYYNYALPLVPILGVKVDF